MSTLSSQTCEKINTSDTLFASCIKHKNGSFGAVLLDQNLTHIKHIPLPDRGHDIVFSPTNHQAIAFARRPGNFAVIFDTAHMSQPRIITAPIRRHFYGHGAFSCDGKLLYASENDYENAAGKIGIYDATHNFKRIGEFNSFGTGPHQILLLRDGKTLVIANGGIETHPDYGRTKLNLATMQSSIVFIDITDGSMIEQHSLPRDVQKLSLRHMAQIANNAIVFGGQYQGPKHHLPQLIGTCKLGEGLHFWQLPEKDRRIFANYTGSIAVDRNQTSVAVSSPKGGIIGVFNAHNGAVQSVIEQPKGNGVTYPDIGLLSSSENGLLKPAQSKAKQYDFAFDNHITHHRNSH